LTCLQKRVGIALPDFRDVASGATLEESESIR